MHFSTREYILEAWRDFRSGEDFKALSGFQEMQIRFGAVAWRGEISLIIVVRRNSALRPGSVNHLKSSLLSRQSNNRIPKIKRTNIPHRLCIRINIPIKVKVLADIPRYTIDAIGYDAVSYCFEIICDGVLGGWYQAEGTGGGCESDVVD